MANSESRRVHTSYIRRVAEKGMGEYWEDAGFDWENPLACYTTASAVEGVWFRRDGEAWSMPRRRFYATLLDL